MALGSVNVSSGGSKGITKVERKTFISEYNAIPLGTGFTDAEQLISISGHGRLLEILVTSSYNGDSKISGYTNVVIDSKKTHIYTTVCTATKRPASSYLGRKILTTVKDSTNSELSGFGVCNPYTGTSPNLFSCLSNNFANPNTITYISEKSGYEPVLTSGGYGYIPDGIPFNENFSIGVAINKTTDGGESVQQDKLYLICVYELYS